MLPGTLPEPVLFRCTKQEIKEIARLRGKDEALLD
jgi:hypothetical protein